MVRSRKVSLALMTALLVCSSVMITGAAGAEQSPATETISVNIPVGDYAIEHKDGRQTAIMTDYGNLLVPGKPKLPSRIFAVAIPPGARVVDISYEAGTGIELAGSFSITPSPLPRVIGNEDPALYALDRQEYEYNLQSVYGSDERYPEQVVEFVRSAGYREYNLVDVRVTPFAYQPLSGRLTYYPDITVNVSYQIAGDQPLSKTTVNGFSRQEVTAQEIIVNFDQTADWHTKTGASRGVGDYVIITLPSLTASMTALVDWETAKGRSVEVATTDWIALNYSGYDLAAKMRAFLRDKYPSAEWGIEDVLLVGDYDDVPMRRTAQDVGYGAPETDFYYAELSLPDSLSWDSDGDHSYGEYSDAIDFYAEVYVGRIPWSDPTTVAAICAKSVAYEQNNDPAYKRNMLLLGAYFWASTDNAELMERKTDAALNPWMSDWTFTRMYEQNTDYWSSYECDYPLLNFNVMNTWPTGTFGFVNWAGHGSPTSCHIYGLGAPAFISTSDCSQLSDEYPAIIFADACSNSDTDNNNLGRAMLQHGAVGFVGATKVAYGCPGWQNPDDGSSQSLDYQFTTRVTSGEYSQGGALQMGLIHMYTYGLWDDLEYETFEWGALWGNPNLWIGSPPFQILVPEGTPEFAVPYEEATVTVQINEGADTYVPGSAKMYYRLEGTHFLSSSLVHVAGDLWEATLPAAECDDTLQYYFAANGDECGIVLCPADAPATMHTTIVGELIETFADDFNTDNGWTVVNDPSLGDGAWERGSPVGGGDRGDPPTDYDGSGQCFLTDNVDDNSDVDDGMTSLYSPLFDLSDGEGRISYARWYSNNFGGDPHNDVMQIYISNDGGSNWTLVETVGPSEQANGGWFEYSFWVDDVIAGTDQMQMRFDASDLGEGSVVEAGVDDFQVTFFHCELPLLCGDADGSELVNISDAVFVINYIFGGGPAPDPLEAADVNCDSVVNISDAVYLIAYVFSGGPEPCFDCP